MASKGDVLVNIETSETGEGRSGLNLLGPETTEADVRGINGTSECQPDSGLHVVSHEEKDGTQPVSGSQSGQSSGEDETKLDSGSEGSGDVETQPGSGSQSSGDSARRDRDLVELQAETLAEFIVDTLIGKRNGQTKCVVERTLLRCVKTMLQEHELVLKGMMKRLHISREIGYDHFDIVAFELFDGGKGITWARIIALYTFGGRLALHCKEQNMEDFCCKITDILGKTASEFVTPYVKKAGGWVSLFPPRYSFIWSII